MSGQTPYNKGQALGSGKPKGTFNAPPVYKYNSGIGGGMGGGMGANPYNPNY